MINDIPLYIKCPRCGQLCQITNPAFVEKWQLDPDIAIKWASDNCCPECGTVPFTKKDVITDYTSEW